ncbi:MAG: IPT/TIG domain-containing protein [Deltaproteobacteria bacterium]|nr:IPT/TIG domain-containing protein [Deltaproteobacteria bacterium]
MFKKNRLKYLLFILISGIFSTVTVSCDTVTDNHTYNNTSMNNFNNDAGIDSSFRVTLVDPGHGSSLGGNQVEIRGFGFDDVTRIFFGETWADPNETYYVDPSRMLCTVPAGEAGSVTVTAMRGDGTTTSLENGYVYDSFKLDPDGGNAAGGTLVRIYSPANEFDPSDRFFIGESELVEVNYISSGLITGKTPSGYPGTVDFTVEKENGDKLITEDAWLYYDSSDPGYGGMNGIAINGNLTVTVLNYYTKEPVEDAFVILGSNIETPWKGYTTSTGQITFASPDLAGYQMVTAAAEGFENTSFIGFDASEITIFLQPLEDPPSSGGGIPHIPDSVYAHINGGLVLKEGEFSYSCQFHTMIPDPVPEGFVKVVRIYQSLSWYDYASADILRIYETSLCVDGYGYPFNLTLWPSVFAMYALGGYESLDGKTFLPVSYGIIRNIMIGPGETLAFKLAVEYTLGGFLSVNLLNPVPLDETAGPVSHRAKLIMNLGSDGFILREDHIQSSTDENPSFTFEKMMELNGPLEDATYSVFAESHNNGTYPFSKIFIQNTSENVVNIDTFLPLPTPVTPVDEAPLSNRFTFESGENKPTFTVIKFRTLPEGNMWWSVYINGEMNSFVLPDLDQIPQLEHTPPSDIYWNLQSILVPSLDFNNFSYRYLNKRYWISNSADGAGFSY